MKRKSFNPAQVPTAISLESVHVATPCHADWDEMRGDDRSRFCPSCAKNVYNLSAMTSTEAQMLLEEKEGRLCVRFFQREDGTMLTQDCPVGVAAMKERSPSFALWAGVASLALLAGALLSPTLSSAQAQPEPKSQAPALTATPTPEPTAATPLICEPSYPAMMGDIAPAPRPTAAPTPSQPSVTMGKPVMPRATPTPKSAVKGEASVVPTAEPAPLLATLGEMAVAPTPKPKVQKHTMVLGRMVVRPTTQPTPAAPQATLGFAGAMQLRPAQPKTSKAKAPKKSASTKRS